MSLFVAATAALSSTSEAVTLALSGISNTTVGLITLDPIESPAVTLRSAVSGRAIFVSVSTSLSGVATSMNSLLASATSTSAQFDTALATLIGTTNASTSPGIVRSTTFTSGAMTSTGSVQLGNAANSTYLFLVSEANGVITGIGAYTGSAVPNAGSVTFNPAFAGDSLGIGTSVLAAATTTPSVQPVSGFQLKSAVAAIPEPSAALLGAIGALVLLRRRRI